MSALAFIQSLCILATVAGLVVYLRESAVRESRKDIQLDQARRALKVIDAYDKAQAETNHKLAELDSKVTAFCLKEGWNKK